MNYKERSIELAIHRELGNGKWWSVNAVLHVIGRDADGYDIDWKWMSDILNQMVADGKLETRHNHDYGTQYRLLRHVD